LRFFGPHGLDGPHGFAAFFFAGPHGLEASFLGAHGFFCSAPAGAGVSADCASGATAKPANAIASAATVDFLDIYISLSVLKIRLLNRQNTQKRSAVHTHLGDG
jgi:hypothetical protein